jgi:hypothetical protein
VVGECKKFLQNLIFFVEAKIAEEIIEFFKE